MSHGMTETDHMMYVGETPWHGLGTKLNYLADAKKAITAAKLNWKVNKIPIEEALVSPYKANPNLFLTIREDTNTVLGVVRGRYTPIQNEEAFHFFDDVTIDKSGPKYVTAGSLDGGVRVWILAKMPAFIEVEGDRIEQYILLWHSHDGESQLEMMWTPVRVVCQNTLAMAISSTTDILKIRHLRNWQDKKQQAQDFLGIIRNQEDVFRKTVKNMIHYDLNYHLAQMVIEKLLPIKDEDDPNKERIETNREEIRRLIVHGAGNHPYSKTA